MSHVCGQVINHRRKRRIHHGSACLVNQGAFKVPCWEKVKRGKGSLGWWIPAPQLPRWVSQTSGSPPTCLSNKTKAFYEPAGFSALSTYVLSLADITNKIQALSSTNSKYPSLMLHRISVLMVTDNHFTGSFQGEGPGFLLMGLENHLSPQDTVECHTQVCYQGRGYQLTNT